MSAGRPPPLPQQPPAAPPPLRFKCVVVGDLDSRKAALLARIRDGLLTCDCPPATQAATSCDDFVTTVEAPTQGGGAVELHLIDASGHELHDRMRPIWYHDLDAVWLCFSVMRPDTLASVEAVWMPELRRECPPGAPVVLIGTMADQRTDATALLKLRQSLGQGPVSQAKVAEVAGRLGAAGYVECSARTGRGLRHLLQLTVSAVLREPVPSPSPSQLGGGGRLNARCRIL